MKLNIHDRFNKELQADSVTTNQTRQVKNACFSFVKPRVPSNPKLIHAEAEVAELIGLTHENTESNEFLEVFSGKKVVPNTQPYAMNYAGHQFGNWAGQLGDGRAINLFEIKNNNQSYTIQLKGAGKTPYSRNGDGLAVLRSSIREHLCSEAMLHLGVPTSRSLSLVLSGDEVLRDMLYDGNSEYEKGAIVTRVAPSFIRFGSFELFASQNDLTNLKLLTDYTINHFFSDIIEKGKDRYLKFFETVTKKTLQLIIEWQRIGFVHGVMNTDNMSIHGITIDYGPYGWLEDYNPNWTPNTTDSQNKRYAYGNQPEIALWNLYKLANAIYPLIQETEGLEKILNSYISQYKEEYTLMMQKKLGLFMSHGNDINLIEALETVLTLTETDFTLFFRELSKVKKESSPSSAISEVNLAFYHPEELNNSIIKEWENWFTKYINRLHKETTSDDERKIAMNKTNPKYVLRNYMAHLSIEAANNDDYSVLYELNSLLKKPYDEQPEMEKWYTKRPDWARVKVGCSMLSCSS